MKCLDPFIPCHAIVRCGVVLLLAPIVSDVLASDVHFNRDIRPILNANCVPCHGGVKQAGGLSFIYANQVLPPDGWVIEPGEPEASVLLDRVTETNPSLRMPPPQHGPQLSRLEIDLLTRWIEQGAPWALHWAFEKPTAPALPDVTRPEWIKRPLDRFVLSRLEQEGLDPASEADPRRWLRRVSLDVIGLPPTLEQMKTFLTEIEKDGELAYERAVDRLLAAPQFGERWASVWLDQVRYADTKGLGADSPRSVWKYRDWVIRALNDDLPYDEFTRKQIAGDLTTNPKPDDLIATACHRLTQTNEEGGTDDEEFRIAAVLDRVNTTWQTWQGITFGCAQCHGHPYEPIEHAEYYEFAAFFNNTMDCDLDSDAPVYLAPKNPVDDSTAHELDREINGLVDSVWQQEYELLSDGGLWKPLAGLEATTNNGTQFVVDSHPERDEFRLVGTIKQNTDITLEAELPAGMKRLAAVRITGMPLDPETALLDSEWGFVWSGVSFELLDPSTGGATTLEVDLVIADEPHPLLDPQESINPKSGSGYGAYSRIHYPREAAFVLADAVDVPKAATLRVRLNHRVFLLAAFSLVTKRGHLAVSDSSSLADVMTSTELRRKRDRLAELRAKRKEIPSVSTPVIRERPAHLSRLTHVFERGLFLTKGELVSANVPDAFHPIDFQGPYNRSALADWLVSEDNPLTARVAVNRYWARLFGVGLVETEEDFGSSGEPPSHPDLLDHLATRFQHDFSWSVKRLIREIVLSATYRQSAVARPELNRVDPANRLLGRGPRHRLPAETVRDQALAIAGLINSEMFGSPVRPPIPSGVWQPFGGREGWPATEPGEPGRYRRSIYTYVKRSIPYPMFATFDQSSREFCTPRRLRSNTPLQALEMLNSETFDECSRAFAERIKAHSEDANKQLAYGFELATCRPPSKRELELLQGLYSASEDADAGREAVAAALLNLDEVLMK